MPQPPAIEPAPKQGPDYDPMDPIVEALENISSFLTYLDQNHQDTGYFQKHFPGILELRKDLAQQIDLLANGRYAYPHARLIRLHQENEKIFSLLEGLAGGIDPWDRKEFKKFKNACEKEISRFDQDLTP